MRIGLSKRTSPLFGAASEGCSAGLRPCIRDIWCRCGAVRSRRLPAARTGRVLLVDGIHDLGGMHGFGAVVHSPAEPAFHHQWQAVARALMMVVADAVEASGGEFRRSIERMEPGHYLASSYYE